MSSTEETQPGVAPETPAAEEPAPVNPKGEESMDTTPAPTTDSEPSTKTEADLKIDSTSTVPAEASLEPVKTDSSENEIPKTKIFQPAQPASGPGQFIKPPVPKTIQTDRPSKKTIEQMEEAKLKAKFGGLQKPGGTQFLQKRLNKPMKYFDSGDYNMAKQSGKLKMRPISGKQGAAPRIPNPTGEAIPTPDSIPHRKPSSEISKLAV